MAEETRSTLRNIEASLAEAGCTLADVVDTSVRRLFLIGISLFTMASVACGISTTQGLLVAARAVQGIGGARGNGHAPSIAGQPQRRRPANARRATGDEHHFVAEGMHPSSSCENNLRAIFVPVLSYGSGLSYNRQS